MSAITPTSMRSISTKLTLFRVALRIQHHFPRIRADETITQVRRARIRKQSARAHICNAGKRIEADIAPVFHSLHDLHGSPKILIGLVQFITRSLQLPPLAIEIAQHCATCTACGRQRLLLGSHRQKARVCRLSAHDAPIRSVSASVRRVSDSRSFVLASRLSISLSLRQTDKCG